MYKKEKDLIKCICWRTISPSVKGRPCIGRKCASWEPLEYYKFNCDKCKHINTMGGLETKDNWGRCGKRYSNDSVKIICGSCGGLNSYKANNLTYITSTEGGNLPLNIKDKSELACQHCNKRFRVLSNDS
jgi:phage FluMu protein Com